MANRSTYPVQIDTFIELYSLPPEQYVNAERMKVLMQISNKTQAEIDELNNLQTTLQHYFINPEIFNKFCNCLTNIENFCSTTFTNYFRYRGNWSSTVVSGSDPYRIFNTIRYTDGCTYLALVDYPSNPPTDTTQWLQNSQKGDKGDPGLQGEPGINLVPKGTYDPNITYGKDQLVVFNGSAYYSLIDGLLSVTPGSDAIKWQIFTEKGASVVTKLIPNAVTLTVAASNVLIGITAYTSSTDTLMVFKNGQELRENEQYKKNANGISIDSYDASQWPIGSEFDFWVFKNINQNMNYADGGLILDNSITLPKLSIDIQGKITKIGTATLTTTAQDLSGAVNEVNSAVVSHEADYTTHFNEYVTDTGNASAYVINPIPTITAYAVGQIFKWKATNANTGASTLNVNGKGAINLVKNGSTALATGDILVDQMCIGIYDGTNIQMIPTNVSSNGWNKITSLTVPSDATVLDFQSLGIEDYKYIKLIIEGQSSNASSQNIYLKFNNNIDSASYDWKTAKLGSTVTASLGSPSATTIQLTNFLPQYYRGIGEILISNTANQYKVVTGVYYADTSYDTYSVGGRWFGNTSKINRITISSYFKAGSIITLLGMK